MKKTILYIIISLFAFLSIGVINHVSAASGSTIYVTEKVPGAGCELQSSGSNEGMYKCTIEPGFSSIMSIMGKLLKYFTFIAGLLAVLMLVIGGIMYSMGGADEGMKTKSKEFITKSLLGLVLLLVSGSFLYAVAPWVYK